MSTERKPGWREVLMGAIIQKPGSSVKVRTGDWRTFRPVINHDKCVKCLICWIYCPDASVIIVGSGDQIERIEIDYEHCKGCGICATECPHGAINMVPEGG